jgi:hypothetical protein
MDTFCCNAAARGATGRPLTEEIVIEEKIQVISQACDPVADVTQRRCPAYRHEVAPATSA